MNSPSSLDADGLRFVAKARIGRAVTADLIQIGLSDAERQMLNFSESDPEFAVNPAVVERLQAEISDEDYEAKVAGLLERSWKRDVETDSNARSLYREAFTTLSQGDHYLLTPQITFACPMSIDELMRPRRPPARIVVTIDREF